MSDIKNKSLSTIDQLVSQPYKYGFETTIENERIPIGLDENTIRLLSKKKE
jgi:Fe-S cluster assembly protein SufB